VWDLDKTDKNKNPQNIRSIKILFENKPYTVRILPRAFIFLIFFFSQVSCIAALENLSQLAVGLANGAVILMRGDISRDRFIKQKILLKGNNPITGLSFREQGRDTFLFVMTPEFVDVYNTTNNKDTKELLAEQGCELDGYAMTEPEMDLVLGKREVRILLVFFVGFLWLFVAFCVFFGGFCGFLCLFW